MKFYIRTALDVLPLGSGKEILGRYPCLKNYRF